jgi:hypothetical protein
MPTLSSFTFTLISRSNRIYGYRLRHTTGSRVTIALLSMSVPSSTLSKSPKDNTPRPSASLVIVNKWNEILLVHRNPQARSFGGVHVRCMYVNFSLLGD